MEFQDYCQPLIELYLERICDEDAQDAMKEEVYDYFNELECGDTSGYESDDLAGVQKDFEQYIKTSAEMGFLENPETFDFILLQKS